MMADQLAHYGLWVIGALALLALATFTPRLSARESLRRGA
jgi:hypothetical protein